VLVFSMGVSVDGFVNDRDGDFGWTPPDDDLFAFHTELVGAHGAYLLGRRLYEAMVPWETDPAMRATEAYNTFADIWSALPKVVFSTTLDRVEGENTRLAEGSVADEVAAALATVAGTDKDVSIGGADLAGQALMLDLVDELRIFRHPVLVGGGTPYFPPFTHRLELDLIETRTFGSRVVFERYRRPRT
jgi:dihydrofolate reductase